MKNIKGKYRWLCKNKQTGKQTKTTHTHKVYQFYSTKTSKSYTTANCPSRYNISTRHEIHFIYWKIVAFILSSYIFSGLTALVNVHVMYKWFMAFLYPGFELIQKKNFFLLYIHVLIFTHFDILSLYSNTSICFYVYIQTLHYDRYID